MTEPSCICHRYQRCWYSLSNLVDVQTRMKEAATGNHSSSRESKATPSTVAMAKLSAIAQSTKIPERAICNPYIRKQSQHNTV